MIRIIDGVAYEGKPGEAILVRCHDLGNGHLEFSGQRETVWEEKDWSPMMIEFYREAVEKDKLEREAELAEKRLQIAANHAKRRVRRLCKAMGADTLLTLTYRGMVTDLAQCKRDLKEFVRRLRRVIPGFRAVACFELQERGCWHVHMATQRFPAMVNVKDYRVKSFNLIRSVWRSVTQENAGTINVSSTKRNSKRSPAKIAAYIAKYISKAFVEGVKGSNRWTRFGDVELPPPVNLGRFSDMRECVEACYALVDDCAVVADQHLSKWGDWFYLVVEGQRVKV